MMCQGALSHILWRAFLGRITPVSGIRFSAGTPVSIGNSRCPPSKEVRMLVNMIASDPRSTTFQNLRYLRKVIKLEDPEQFSSWRIKEELPKQDVPQAEQWRLGLMTRLMHMKQNLYMEVQDSQKITAMLDSLCST